MIEEVGVICAIEKADSAQFIWVETEIKSTCGSCEAQSNCGTGAIAKVFANKREKLHFRFDQAVEVGQKVSLGIPEENLLKASMLVYFLPLVILVCSALIGQELLPLIGLLSEVWLVIFSALCTYLTFKFVSRHLKSSDQSEFYPQILKVLPFEKDIILVKQL
jgi:sigma-E factor negative regulatory protein RseC